MKSKKIKLITSLLSVGALGAILIPTITLTSCSATATPYLQEFTSVGSKVNNKSINFVAKFNSSNMMTSAEINENGTKFDMTSFDKQWAELRKTQTNLPESIYKVENEITNQQVKNLVEQQNYLTLFVSAINNLRSVYENYNSLFIFNSPQIAEIFKDNFVKFLTYGLNISDNYARLWLSDIKFDANVTLPSEIGKLKTDEEIKSNQEITVELSNIHLTYKWYELQDDGSTCLDTVDKIQNYDKSLTEKDLSFDFKVKDMELFFNNTFNKKEKDKNYLIGLIAPNPDKPLSFNFNNNNNNNNQSEQNRIKTDFFNKEVLELLKNKAVDNKQLNDLYGKIGYLTKNNMPENNNISSNDYTNNENIATGKNFVKELLGTRDNK